jgi:hypothetical protein
MTFRRKVNINRTSEQSWIELCYQMLDKYPTEPDVTEMLYNLTLDRQKNAHTYIFFLSKFYSC